MRVLHIYSGNLYGGIETLLVTLARHQNFCPEMEQHFALCFEGRLSEELIAAGAPVHLLGNVRTSRPISVWQAQGTLRRLLGCERFEVVICHSAWSQTIFGPVVRAARLPLVFWLHGATTGQHWLERWARRTPPDLVICNSQYTASTLHNMYPHAQSEVIYYPVTPPQADGSYDGRAAVRAELKALDNTVVIIQVSRMEAWKGHTLLFKALSLLGDLSNWVCWVVGGAQRPQEAEYLKELKSQSARLGIADHIRFLGQRSDVPRLLTAADIHCQPNIEPEPFGITFIEALYAGLPVVTTALGGAKEIIDKSCGVLVPPNDAYALAASLRQLIQNRTLRLNLGDSGSSRARKLCDAATQVGQLNKVLASVVYQEVAG